MRRSRGQQLEQPAVAERGEGRHQLAAVALTPQRAEPLQPVLVEAGHHVQRGIASGPSNLALGERLLPLDAPADAVAQERILEHRHQRGGEREREAHRDALVREALEELEQR